MSTQNFAVSGTWTCPTGVTSVTAQVWGSGGNGGRGAGGSAGQGGGGGGFSETTGLAVTPGNNYTVTVDPAGNEGFSEFTGDSASVVANSGGPGTPGSAGTGAIAFAGGNVSNVFNSYGTGGSGSAGSTGNGGAGGFSGGGMAPGGTAGPGSPGGAAGGAGGNIPSGSGSSGSYPGGGGGGGSIGGGSGGAGGAGGAGLVTLIWTVPVLGALSASFNGTAAGVIGHAATGALSASFSGMAVGAVQTPGTGSLTATFTGTAIGAIAFNATGSMTVTFNAGASGVSGVAGSMTVTFTGMAIGVLTTKGTGSLSASFSGAAAGVIAELATGNLSATFTGTASGVSSVSATGNISATFTGTATGAVISVSGRGSLVSSFLGFATGTVEGAAPVFPTPVLPQGIHGLSSQFIQAVTSDHQLAIQVQIFNNAGVFLQDISEFITAGSVTVDETAEIRRICSLTIEGTTNLVPANLTDLLHPATGNEIKIWRGVQYQNGTTEYAQLGVFRMTKPNITDDGANVTITVNGQDRASVLARISWQMPYTIPAGINIAGAIEAAVNHQLTLGGSNAIPGLTFNFSGTSFSYPATTFGASPGSPSDPMSDLITFAAAAACELFFDVFGAMTFRPISTSQGISNIVDSVHFVEGENCTMDSVGRVLDESTAYNGVILYCNGTGSAGPFSSEAWDTNPASPTYYLGKWGQVPYVITTTAIPAVTQTLSEAKVAAGAMAFAQLQLILGSFDDVNLTTVPNPALREGDAVQVTRARMRIDNSYIISGMTIPLDPKTSMSINFRPRISAQ